MRILSFRPWKELRTAEAVTKSVAEGDDCRDYRLGDS